MSADLIIRRGRVIDPANNIDKVCDVAVKEGHVLAVGENLPLSSPREVNGEGHIVCPGLIDCHVHCYQYCTPLGINVDKCCLARGTTTVVDAGSAGANSHMIIIAYK